MRKIVSIGKCVHGSCGVGAPRWIARSIALSVCAAATTLWFDGAYAAVVQFSRSEPVVLETDPVLRAQAAAQRDAQAREVTAVARRRGPLAPGEEFAPKPNGVRAVFPPVTASVALEHDQRIVKEMPVGLNAGGAISTLPRLESRPVKNASGKINTLGNQASKPTAGHNTKRAFRLNMMGAPATEDDRIVTRPAPVGPASLEELARSLRNDPDLIYQYVRNDIELDPVRGIHKGALGTVLDNAGSPADQAVLMQSLLRLSGYDARIVRGAIRLTAQQFADWYGVSTANVCAVINLMGQTQIPIYEASTAQGGKCPGPVVPMETLAIEHVWVKVNIDGTWYEFDPSYKPHRVKQGIDLSAASGYDQATFLQNATSGATITADLVRGLNRNNIRMGLDAASKKLTNWIRQNKPTATVDDIVGGKSIVPFAGGSLRQAQNPLQDTRWPRQEWTEVPPEWKPTLRVQYQGIDQTFTSDAIYGKQLTISSNAANQPVLKLDGQDIGSPGTPVAQGSDSVVTFTTKHNAYSDRFADETIEQHIKGGGKFLIVNGWGPAGRGLAEKFSSRLEDLRAEGIADDSESVLGASLGVLGAQWMAQKGMSDSMLDRIAGTYSIEQHQVGIAGYTDAAYVDLPSVVSSNVHLGANTNIERAVFDSGLMHGSILESTAVNQTTGAQAVSTVKLLDMAMSQGQTIYSANSANYAGLVKPKLQNCDKQLSAFDWQLSQGYSLLLPVNCALVEGPWKGVAYFARGTAINRHLGAIIGGGYSGGLAIAPQPASTYIANTIKNTQPPIKQTEFFGAQTIAGDPIDMVKGNFLYEHRDIKTGYGDSPDSLSFQRFYSSGRKNQKGILGKGWTHNYDIRIDSASDGFVALGARQALDAVATIIEQKVALDLLNDPLAPPEKFLTAVIAQRWFGEQLIDNTRIVKLGMNGDVFSRTPGGYIAPPGKAVKLCVYCSSSQVLSYLTQAGDIYDFKDGKVSRYTQHFDGRIIDFTWNGDLLSSVENSVGRRLTFTYSNGNLQTVTSPLKTVQYSYDGSGNLTKVTDPDNFATRYEYDEPGRMTKFYEPSFPDTPIVINTYDTLSRIKSQTSAAGNVFDYYFAGSRTEEVGPGGSARTNYVDGDGNLLQVISPAGDTVTNQYDGQNRLVRSTFPEKNRIEYTYDDIASCDVYHELIGGCSHQISSISKFPKPGSTDPTLIEKYTYHQDIGKIWTRTDARGNVYFFQYFRGLPVSESSPVVSDTFFGRERYFSWETVTPAGKPSFSRLSKLSDSYAANGVKTDTLDTSFLYGTDFSPAGKILDSGGSKVQVTTTYDEEGRLISSQREGAPKITYSYDKRDNVISTNENLLGADEVIGYDQNSKEVSRGVAIGGGAMVSCKRYNAMGSVIRVWGPSKTSGVSVCPDENAPVPITDTAYDDHHRTSRVTEYLPVAEGGNRVIEMKYYPDDRLNSVLKAVGTGLAQTYAQYIYNPNGTVAITTDARGNATVNLYDGHDRLYRTHYPVEGSPGKGDLNNFQEYAWDNNNNLISIRKRDGQLVTQTFDPVNLLSTRSFNGQLTHQYRYDIRGLKISSQNSDGSRTITNTYDVFGRLSQSTMGGKSLRYSYDRAGRLIDLMWPDNFHVSITYDAFNRPAQLLENGAVPLATYSYDALGRRAQVTLGNGTRTEFTYDAQGRLSGKSHRFTSSTEDWVATYVRNQVGDIKTQNVTSDRYSWRPGSSATSYTSNVLNQYGTVAGTAITYDLNGNLSGDGVWTYKYDLDNRMISAKRAGLDAALSYDADGRLFNTKIDGVETTLLYDGRNLAAEYNSAGEMTRRYVFGPGVDEPLVQYEGAGTNAKTWLYGNHQGSVVAQANSLGATTGSQAYGPFGETNDTPAARFGFTGQQYLAPLGLYYYKARMYAPMLGRFLQTDPVGYQDDLNWYAYVGNNPVNRNDPDGLAAASAQAFNNSSLGGAATIQFNPATTENSPGIQVAGVPKMFSRDRDNQPEVGGGPPPLSLPVSAADLRAAGRSDFAIRREEALAGTSKCTYCDTGTATTGDHMKSLKSFANDVNNGIMTAKDAVKASNAPSNIKPACTSCNFSKGARELSRVPGPGRWVAPNGFYPE